MRLQRILTTAGIWLLVAAGIFIFVGWQYHHEKTIIEENVREVLKQTAQSVKYILPEGFHSLYYPQGIPDSLDRMNARRLTEYAKERQIRFLYSYALSPSNTVIFTASSIDTNETLEKYDVHYGFNFNEATPELFAAFSNINQVSWEDAKDRWGSFFGVYWTQLENGRPWVAGAEYRKNLYDDKLEAAIKRAVWTFIYIAVFMFLLTVPGHMKLRRERDMYHSEARRYQETLNKIIVRQQRALEAKELQEKR
jgi:hypothetical protein